MRRDAGPVDPKAVTLRLTPLARRVLVVLQESDEGLTPHGLASALDVDTTEVDTAVDELKMFGCLADVTGAPEAPAPLPVAPCEPRSRPVPRATELGIILLLVAGVVAMRAAVGAYATHDLKNPGAAVDSRVRLDSPPLHIPLFPKLPSDEGLPGPSAAAATK